MHDVMIRLYMKQTSASAAEEIRQEHRGKAAEKESGWFLSYKEEMPGVGPVTTVLRVGSQDVTLIRQGSLQMKQQFVRGESGTTWYATPYGRFHMETRTHTLRIERQGNWPVRLSLGYQLWLNEQYVGDVALDLDVEWGEAE